MTDLLDLVNIGQRQSTFRFELLDSTLFPIGELEVESPGVSIENNINRSIKRTMDGLRVPPTIAFDINPLTDRVRPWMVMQDGTEWPLGVFLFADQNRFPYTNGSQAVEGSLVDQGLILDQETARTYTFNPGTNLGDAIRSMLEGLIPSFEIDSVSTTINGAESMTWPAGTSRLAIVNDLCGAAGLYSLFFNNNGTGRAMSVPDLQGTDATLRYGDAVGEQKVYRDTIVLTDDLLSAPNRYIVVNNGMNNTTIAGFWDIPPESPNSKENRGFVVATVLNQQGIESSAAAEAAAKAYGQADFSTYSWATFDAALHPGHDTFDIVSWDSVNYREQSWRMDCVDGGNHRHELRRIYNEPVNVE